MDEQQTPIDPTKVRLLVTLAATVLLVLTILCPGTVSTESLVLFGVAILPWVGTFVESFKIGQNGVEARLHGLETNVDALVDQGAETDSEAVSAAAAVDGNQDTVTQTPVSMEWRAVLSALKSKKYRFRTAGGIAKTSQLELGRVRQILQELKEENLVRQVNRSLSSRIKGKTQPLWGITSEGDQLL